MPEEQNENHGGQAPFRGGSPWLYSVRHYFTATERSVIKELSAKDVHFSIEHSKQALWVVAKWQTGGGAAVRVCYDPDQGLETKDIRDDGNRLEFAVATTIGQYRVSLELLDAEKSLIHFTTRLTPVGELSIPFWPSDTYPLDANGDPLATEGTVHAAQRGPAAAFMYVSLTKPKSGSFLYLQDLTSLNDYCQKTHTVPETRVGGAWPELGYTPPISERSPLPAGEEVVISDAYIRFTSEIPEDRRRSALLYLEMLADIYLHLPKPDTTYHHWPSRALESIHDLSHSVQCTSSQGGHRYFNA